MYFSKINIFIGKKLTQKITEKPICTKKKQRDTKFNKKRRY